MGQTLRLSGDFGALEALDIVLAYPARLCLRGHQLSARNVGTEQMLHMR